MSKAARIRELYAQGLGTAEIAEAVGCSKEYVRVAGRQRGATGTSAIDVAYRERKWGSLQAYHRERYVKHREWYSAYYKNRRATDPAYRAAQNEAAKARRLRRKALEAGAESG